MMRSAWLIALRLWWQGRNFDRNIGAGEPDALSAQGGERPLELSILAREKLIERYFRGWRWNGSGRFSEAGNSHQSLLAIAQPSELHANNKVSASRIESL